MEINIISVGKIKEDYFKKAIEEYEKRLKAYCRVNFIELKDESEGKNLSDKDIDIILDKEGKRILEKIKERSFIIVLDILGRSIDSVEFSKKINDIMLDGISSIDFIIGGSLGISQEVKDKANYSLSFSKFTFPHKLMKVILMEQIYRVFTIINNKTYHK
ncbi:MULTISPECIES: 23S rRNA (pseudouridine(1915)-N(3))-methyltransferase RlmH [Peptoniphilus]|uniref:23S rRNA (pseudouridine(1915)-N(3))-methyltransferase RlmH n=1 Tax=Peptoniphilus TaxID=162289 RepID=UPI0001DCA4D5|nr:23S rRNA (pseudouridine(1915)-N(3))-methyltransferase RlmH [Peptoniphilus sp. oral taxon 836]EFK39747.1 rRNA large subunit m3Psi methyltransferase RlmH [Peptoniphilus sp. oral taxon 836 str. F0141]